MPRERPAGAGEAATRRGGRTPASPAGAGARNTGGKYGVATPAGNMGGNGAGDNGGNSGAASSAG